MDLSWIQGGRRLDNYEVDATGATAKWPDTTHYIATVPADRRWFLWGGVLYVDANASLNVYIRNATDKLIAHLATYAAGTGHKGYPVAANAGSMNFPIVLDAGMYVQAIFGAAQGAGAYGTANVIEVSI